MDTTIKNTIIVTLIVILLILYRFVKKSMLEQKIKELTETSNSLETEIIEKQKLIKQLDNQLKPINQIELEHKLDNIINNQDAYQIKNITTITLLLIILSTLIILYFIYKSTYYIQPENINNAFKDALGL